MTDTVMAGLGQRYSDGRVGVTDTVMAGLG